MMKGIEDKTGVKFPKDLSSEETRQMLHDLIVKHNVECSAPQTISRMIDKLTGHFLEVNCLNPTFITDHPRIMSPLAKWH